MSLSVLFVSREPSSKNETKRMRIQASWNKSFERAYFRQGIWSHILHFFGAMFSISDPGVRSEKSQIGPFTFFVTEICDERVNMSAKKVRG